VAEGLRVIFKWYAQGRSSQIYAVLGAKTAPEGVTGALSHSLGSYLSDRGNWAVRPIDIHG